MPRVFIAHMALAGYPAQPITTRVLLADIGSSSGPTCMAPCPLSQGQMARHRRRLLLGLEATVHSIKAFHGKQSCSVVCLTTLACTGASGARSGWLAAGLQSTGMEFVTKCNPAFCCASPRWPTMEGSSIGRLAVRRHCAIDPCHTLTFRQCITFCSVSQSNA